MDGGWNSDFVFNADRAKHRGGIYWLLFTASFVWPDWPVGSLGETSRHYVFTAILRNRWVNWYGSLVLTQKNDNPYLYYSQRPDAGLGNKSVNYLCFGVV